MCFFKTSAPPPPPPAQPPAPPPPPPADAPVAPVFNETSAEAASAKNYVSTARRGRRSLRIDRTSTVPTGGSGLHIPR